MTLEQRPLTNAARTFLIGRLAGSGPLGQRLASSGLRDGKLFTMADRAVPVQQLHAFNDAGVAPPSPIIEGQGHRIQRVQRPSEETVRDVIAAHLDDPAACVVAREGLARPTDPSLERLAGAGVLLAPFANEDVFLVTLRGPEQLAHVARLLRNVNPFFGFIVVTRAADGISWTSLRSSDLDVLGARARLVVVPAYDAEGYVFWESTGGAHV